MIVNFRLRSPIILCDQLLIQAHNQTDSRISPQYAIPTILCNRKCEEQGEVHKPGRGARKRVRCRLALVSVFLQGGVGVKIPFPPERSRRPKDDNWICPLDMPLITQQYGPYKACMHTQPCPLRLGEARPRALLFPRRS